MFIKTIVTKCPYCFKEYESYNERGLSICCDDCKDHDDNYCENLVLKFDNVLKS